MKRETKLVKHKWEGFSNAVGYFRQCANCGRIVPYPELPDDECLGRAIESQIPKGRTWADRCRDEERYNR